MNLERYVFETASPEVFGSKHIVGTIIAFIMVAILLLVLFLVLKNHKHSRVLKITAVFILTLEATSTPMHSSSTGISRCISFRCNCAASRFI